MAHKTERRVRKRREAREAKKAGMTPERTAMLEALKARRKANLNVTRIDNSKLRAGEPMYYYCRLCGAEMKLPEEHVEPAPKRCEPCKELLAQGWDETTLTFQTSASSS